MRIARLVVCFLLGSVSLLGSGCFLGPGPARQSLMLDVGCSEAPSAQLARPLILAITPFSAPAALDRRGVGIQLGRVMRTATTWSWEDTPRRLVTDAVQARLACAPGWSIVTPYRPRAAHDAVLGGRVEAFTVMRTGNEVDDGGKVVIRMAAELWSKGKGPLLSQYVVESEAPFSALDAQAVAVAASSAMEQALTLLMEKLEGARQTIEAGRSDLVDGT